MKIKLNCNTCQVVFEKHQYEIKPNKRISKQSQAKNKNGCPINTTEREWCLELGLARIWDCGKKRWIYEIN